MRCFGSRKKSKKKQLQEQIAQLHQEYNELKLKNNEYIEEIARQKSEIKAIQTSLISSPPATSDVTHLEDKLRETNHRIQAKDQEIDKLQNDWKSRTVNQSETIHQLLKEKDQLLCDKENQATALQQQWEAKCTAIIKAAKEKAVQELQTWRQQNDETQNRVHEKDKEIEILRNQLNQPVIEFEDEELDKETASMVNEDLQSNPDKVILCNQIQDMQRQLEAATESLDMMVSTHQTELAAKEKALLECQQTINHVQTENNRAMETLEKKFECNVQDHEQRFRTELNALTQAIQRAEKQAKSKVHDDVEKLLWEFEQTEHDDRRTFSNPCTPSVSITQREVSPQPSKSSTLALSPAVFRSTSSNLLKWSALQQQNKVAEVIPKDPKEIHVYISSVTGNAAIRRDQEAMQTSLTKLNIPFRTMDVAQSDSALQHMRRQCKGNKQLPLLFVGGHYCGQLKDLDTAIQMGTTFDLLQPRSSTSLQPTPELSYSSSFCSPARPNNAPSKTVSKHWNEDDEALLKEVEKELNSWDLSKIDVVTLI
ncbi:uncharacterized protein BYT42DRAFT_616744 [Radiomyces spectabilis]|uniref:uncharacterized protein n=1 Tax=Radiomyces spectabilis TaxID=64574 RepID=UPI00222018C5|nr:uncharacterized protein BYT42DRAFT_616744 [Radiomyces spectabilis]KAI8371672.1 hypothetical protein BYT42DRAFT_616744 [Radiomyces spectabilis]